MLELISPIIEQVTENNSLAAVSSTALMKLEYGSADFSCEQLFKKSKSMCLLEEQNQDFKKRQLEK